MTGPSSHEAMRDLLPATALEVLDDAEMAAVAAHVRDCEPCAVRLAEYRDVVAALSRLLPVRGLPPARSAAVRTRLLARIRADRAADPQESDPPRRSRWGGWMAAAALGGLLLVHHSVHRPIDHGWLAAGVLLLVLAATAAYASRLRAHRAELRARIALIESAGQNGG